MTDPNTGEPIILPGRRVLVAPQIQALSLNQLMQAQAVWKLTQGGRRRDRRQGPYPGLDGTTGRLGEQRQETRSWNSPSPWPPAASFTSGFWPISTATPPTPLPTGGTATAAAFAYMENWPITVVQAPANSEAQFNQERRCPLQSQRARHPRDHGTAADDALPRQQHEQFQRSHPAGHPVMRRPHPTGPAGETPPAGLLFETSSRRSPPCSLNLTQPLPERGPPLP